MNPLNSYLYTELQRQFGEVQVRSAGEAFVGYPLRDSYHYIALNEGETYCVACPYCRTKDKSLAINHIWGIPDRDGNARWNLVKCFRSDCLSGRQNNSDLIRRIYMNMGPIRRGRLTIQQGRTVPLPPAAISPPAMNILPITDLPSSHPAIEYLHQQGFDPQRLYESYRIGWIEQGGQEVPSLANRIFIPFWQGGNFVSWIARSIEAVCPPSVPRDLWAPGALRHVLLYNLDLARSQPFGILCADVADVWKIGSPAVAKFAYLFFYDQMKFLEGLWPVLVVLNGHKYDEKAVLLLRQLEWSMTIVRVRLPEPAAAAVDFDTLWDAIYSQALQQGVDLCEIASVASAEARSGIGTVATTTGVCESTDAADDS